MARCIARLGDLYFEWSSVVDAPTTYGGTKAQIRQMVIADAAEKAGEDFDRRTDGLKSGETTWRNQTVRDLASFNRIGDFGENPKVKTIKGLKAYLLSGEVEEEGNDM